MNDMNINRYFFSEVFWRIIFANGSPIIEGAKSRLAAEHLNFEVLRSKADYNTGSISMSAAVCLVLLCNYFRPTLIAEVGTFIGRSTFSLMLGGRMSGYSGPTIHTCDMSNCIDLSSFEFRDQVVQYQKKSSSEMFTQLRSRSLSPEMYVIDGRLQKDDLPLLKKLRAESAIIVLDDFEGYEKGVVNADRLLETFKDNFLLAYPISSSHLALHNLNDFSTVAVLIPRSKLRFVNQG